MFSVLLKQHCWFTHGDAVLHGGAGPIIPEDDELAASLDEALGPPEAELEDAFVVDTDVLTTVDTVVSSGRAPVLPPPPPAGPNWKSG